MRAHPAANLFPMLGVTDLRALAADIKANGQHEPIIVFEKKILDGRNRYAACRIAKTKPKMKVLVKCDSPTTFVISANLHRRHLTATQKDVVAVEAAQLFAEEAKSRQRAGGGDRKSANAKIGSLQNATKRSGRALTHAAKAVGAGTRNTAVLAKVKIDAPDVFAAVKAGTVEKIADARRLAEMTPAKRARVIEQMEEPDAKPGLVREVKFAEARKAVAAEAKRAPEQAIIQRSEAIDFLNSIEPHSVDLLLTDPPYMTDVDDIVAFAAEWLPLALSRVKPTGRAYIFTGSYLPEIVAYDTAFAAQSHLPIIDLLGWTYRNTIGPTPTHDYKRNWQALFYARGKDSPPLNCPIMIEQFSMHEVNAPDGRLGNRYHEWQKPDELAERLVRHSTKAGDLVIDPFAGTGTILIAASKLGRRAVGCDSDRSMVKIAVERGCIVE